MLTGLLKDRDITIERLMFWGFCGTSFFIPVATSPAVILGLTTLSLWIFSGKFFKDRDKWLKEKWFPPVLLFMILPWIGLFWSNDIKTGLDFASKSHYWLFALACASLDFYRYSAKTIVDSFLCGLCFIALIFIMQFAGIIPKTNGVNLGFINPITSSLLFVFGILILSFYYSKTNLIKHKVLVAFLMGLFFLSIAIGSGRIGYLSLMLLSPIIAYNLLGRRHILKIAVISILMIGLLLLSPMVQNRIALVASDIKEYQNMNPNTSIGLRLHMWKGAINIFLENPIIGVGTGGYQMAMKKYEIPQLAPEFREFSQPHNSFLYMAANFGIVGLISLFWLFFVFLKKGWIYRDNLIGFSILSLGMIVLIGSLTDTQILQVHTGILFAIFTGLQRALDEG